MSFGKVSFGKVSFGKMTGHHAGYVNMHGFLRIARSMKGLSPTWSPTKCGKRSKMTGKKVWMCCSPGLGGKLWKDTTRRSGKSERCLNIVDAVLYLARQEMAFRRHDESSTSLNQGNYRELLKFLVN